MKVGSTALALFDISFDNIVKRAYADGFDIVEVLCEGALPSALRSEKYRPIRNFIPI